MYLLVCVLAVLLSIQAAPVSRSTSYGTPVPPDTSELTTTQQVPTTGHGSNLRHLLSVAENQSCPGTLLEQLVLIQGGQSCDTPIPNIVFHILLNGGYWLAMGILALLAMFFSLLTPHLPNGAVNIFNKLTIVTWYSLYLMTFFLSIAIAMLVLVHHQTTGITAGVIVCLVILLRLAVSISLAIRSRSFKGLLPFINGVVKVGRQSQCLLVKTAPDMCLATSSKALEGRTFSVMGCNFHIPLTSLHPQMFDLYTTFGRHRYYIQSSASAESGVNVYVYSTRYSLNNSASIPFSSLNHEDEEPLIQGELTLYERALAEKNKTTKV